MNIQDADLFKKNIHPRILAVLPTIEFLTGKGAKVVILSHRGRPLEQAKINSSLFTLANGKGQNSKFSLKPFVKIISKLSDKQIKFIDFKNGFDPNKINKIISVAGGNSIFLLENLRFWPGEEKNNLKFAKKLALLGDFYVNDAFSVSHRANASVTGITKFLPSYAGLLLEKEIKNLSTAIKKPKKPLVVILGGAKISDKIGVIKNFIGKADYFLTGGGIAHNFLLAQGLPIGDSIFEEKTIGFAKKMLKNKKIILPVDYVIENRKILDIGPKTIEKYSKIIKNAKTIIWNGPMGFIEDEKFKKGSEAVAKAILGGKSFAVIGGGETTGMIFNFNKNIFLSTGGGAMLEYLAGEKLPGLEALKSPIFQ